MSKCKVKDCIMCGIIKVLQRRNMLQVNKRLLSAIVPLYLPSDLYDGLKLPELRLIVIDYICELSKINLTRSDFIGEYVGWTTDKTKKLLEFNRNKAIIINDAHSLIINNNDVFGKEAVTTIQLFLVQNDNVSIIFN